MIFPFLAVISVNDVILMNVSKIDIENAMKISIKNFSVQSHLSDNPNSKFLEEDVGVKINILQDDGYSY